MSYCQSTSSSFISSILRHYKYNFINKNPLSIAYSYQILHSHTRNSYQPRMFYQSSMCIGNPCLQNSHHCKLCTCVGKMPICITKEVQCQRRRTHFEYYSRIHTGHTQIKINSLNSQVHNSYSANFMYMFRLL